MPTPKRLASESKKVTAIIADPPYRFAAYSAKGNAKAPKYDTMSVRELVDLGPTIKELAGKHSYLVMWSTAPHLADALAIMSAWGFTYKSYRVWTKARISTGYHVRSNCEIALIGTRGSPGVPGGKKRTSTFAGAPKETRHSSKPIELHEWLEAGFPDAEKIELFARHSRSGWLTLGGDLGVLITPKGIIQQSDLSSRAVDAGRQYATRDNELHRNTAEDTKGAHTQKSVAVDG